MTAPAPNRLQKRMPVPLRTRRPVPAKAVALSPRSSVLPPNFQTAPHVPPPQPHVAPHSPAGRPPTPLPRHDGTSLLRLAVVPRTPALVHVRPRSSPGSPTNAPTRPLPVPSPLGSLRGMPSGIASSGNRGSQDDVRTPAAASVALPKSWPYKEQEK